LRDESDWKQRVPVQGADGDGRGVTYLHAVRTDGGTRTSRITYDEAGIDLAAYLRDGWTIVDWSVGGFSRDVIAEKIDESPQVEWLPADKRFTRADYEQLAIAMLVIFLAAVALWAWGVVAQ
jgi:hypothetical protein